MKWTLFDLFRKAIEKYKSRKIRLSLTKANKKYEKKDINTMSC